MPEKVQLIITTAVNFKEMTEKIELWLNIVHYCIYRADYRLHLLSNRLNPFLLLGKIPALKRKFEEQGTTQEEVVNTAWGNRRYGFGVMISGGGIVIILSFLTWGLVSAVASLLDIYFYIKPGHLIIYGLFSYLICHFTIFKKDKYIKYFKRFDKWSRDDKWKYCLLSLTFIICVIALWIYSFQFLPRAVPR
jgi:hypothetical protein